MRWQSGVDGVGHLIEVVADPPQLCEQRRVHPVERRLRDLDLAPQENDFAVDGELEVGLARFCRETRVVTVRHADVDLPVTLLRRVRVGAGHVSPHQAWVRDVGITS